MREDWVDVRLGNISNIISGKDQKKVRNDEGKYPIYGSSGLFDYANEYLCEPGTTIIGRKGTINSPILVNEKFWNIDTAFGMSPLSIVDSKYFYYFCCGFNFKKLDKSTTIPSLAKRDIEKITFKLSPLPEQRAIVAKIEQLFSELDNGIANLKTAQEQLKVYRQAVLKKAFEGDLTQEWRESHIAAKHRVSTDPKTNQPIQREKVKTPCMASQPASQPASQQTSQQVSQPLSTSLPTAEDLLTQIKTERKNHYQQQLEDWKQGKISSKPKQPKELPPLTKEELEKLPELPDGWKWVKLSDVNEIKSNLVSPEVYKNMPHIAPDNIQRETGKLLNYNTIEEDKVFSPKHYFYDGQIIYSKIRPYLNKLIIAKFEGLCSADMYPIESKMQIKFLFHLMLSKYFVDKSSNSGSRTILPKINQTELGRIPLPFCSFEEQHQIVQEIESRLLVCEKVEENIQDSLNKAEALRQSILKKAFEGNLLSASELEACRQEPDWEPAEKLLERIR
ncbi:MAG: restriction endonuclease subunit S [Candidatus Marinimicrobia bacterium]|nr:restriction endonuclease subunit S [Candidatus Neomarinimicrobiota bacterium]